MIDKTFIYKSNDFDSLALRGYRSTLYSLNKENEANKQTISELDKQLSVLKRQKTAHFVPFFVFYLLYNYMLRHSVVVYDIQLSLSK
mgnify:CR=1 FL=1